jgi:hypothetical protein
VNEKLESMQKEAVTAYVKILSQHFHGGTEQNYEEH